MIETISRPNFPRQARDEIVLRMMVAHRLDFYWAMGPNIQDIFLENREKFEAEWKPDPLSQRDMRTAMSAAQQGGCNALKRIVYEKQILPPEHERIDRDVDAICTGIHMGFQNALGPFRHIRGFEQERHDASHRPIHINTLADHVYETRRLRGGVDGTIEQELASYHDPIFVFVRDIFRDVAWQRREPKQRRHITRVVRSGLDRQAWRLIDQLRANRDHLGPQLRRLKQRALYINHLVPNSGWRRDIVLAAVLAAADVAVALFPHRCRQLAFRREDLARHGFPLPPPMVVPAYLDDRRDAAVERFARGHGRELWQLGHLRPRPAPLRNPLRTPQAGVPFPHGIPKADLLAGRPRQQLERTNSL